MGKMTNRWHRMVSGVLIVCIGALGTVVPAQAAIVGSETLVQETAQEQGAADRAAVRESLIALGVPPADAATRVDALSDAEAGQLAAQLDALPAGGDLIGAALIVFLVLLATDIMGYTKVFPFTRSVR
jgi:Family of unknown function (DUF6627)